MTTCTAGAETPPAHQDAHALARQAVNAGQGSSEQPPEGTALALENLDQRAVQQLQHAALSAPATGCDSVAESPRGPPSPAAPTDSTQLTQAVRQLPGAQVPAPTATERTLDMRRLGQASFGLSDRL